MLSVRNGTTTPAARWLAWLIQGFAIDVRSLAVFRMALAAMVLVDLAERLPDLAAHYTDAGVLPRAARIAMQHDGSNSAGKWAWSLHMATGTTAGQAVLFLLAALFAVWMLIGYRTQLATALSWMLAVSLYNRNPMFEDVGDTMLRTVLFWAIFLPLGGTLSVDRRLRRLAPVTREIISLAGTALLLQICIVYWAGAAEKRSPVWLKDHTALYYTLSLDAFATPLGHRLLAFPRLLSWLTMAVYWLEWLGPVFALSPLARGPLRLLVVLAFWSFHLGTALTLELGGIPWVSIAAWTAFLPGPVWDKLGWMCPTEMADSATEERPSYSRANAHYRRRPALVSFVVGPLLVYVALWNINQVSGCFEGRVPRQWKVPAYLLGLEQTWRMFAPFPLKEDGWYEMRGVLADGSVVNLWDDRQPLPRLKPQRVAATYRNRHWRKYLVELRVCWSGFAPDFAQWLRNRWNLRHAGDMTGRWVKHVQVVYHIEQTLSPDRSSTFVLPEIVFEGDFSAPMDSR